jgi:allantoinase
MQRSIQSRRVVTEDGIRPVNIVFEGGRILSLGEYRDAQPIATDFGDLCILPGLIDTHVHINEPGRTEWEGFATATRAAAAGGYTCLVDMPLNSIPSTTNVAALAEKREAASHQSLVDYAFWGGLVKGNSEELPSLADSGVVGFKAFLIESGVAEFAMVREDDLRLAMPIIARSGLPLLVHAELPAPVEQAHARLANRTPWNAYFTYLESRPEEAEVEAVELMIRLCREFQCHVHIVHLASAKALPMLKQARAEGLKITVETCPHYLYFAAEAIPDRGTQYKCAPPIRSAENCEELWQALRDGVIDLVATDHSPCPPALKRLPPESDGDFCRAWGGIGSLSVALPAMWTKAKARHFTLTDIVRWMSTHPAALAGLQLTKGRIAPGYDADFVVFDPDANLRVGRDSLHFRHPVSPYLGEELVGVVRRTYVRGNCVFVDGRFAENPVGRECKPFNTA